MKEPMLTLVENAIGASFGPSAEKIPAGEFNAAVKVAALAALMALRTPGEAMLYAGSSASISNGTSVDYDRVGEIWQSMIDSAMQEA